MAIRTPRVRAMRPKRSLAIPCPIYRVRIAAVHPVSSSPSSTFIVSLPLEDLHAASSEYAEVEGYPRVSAPSGCARTVCGEATRAQCKVRDRNEAPQGYDP